MGAAAEHALPRLCNFALDLRLSTGCHSMSPTGSIPLPGYDGLLLMLQLSMPLPGTDVLPGADLLPGNYPGMGSAGGASPRSPITVTMPATRQPDLPYKKHHR